jgi:hypothetical protein
MLVAKNRAQTQSMQSLMSARPYTMTVEKWGVRVVNAPGFALTPKSMMPKWQIMIDKCLETRKKRLLIETPGLRLELNVNHLYELIDFMIAKGFQGGKIAFVMPGWEATPESDLLQTIGFNRGIYSRIFEDSDSAIAWLKT